MSLLRRFSTRRATPRDPSSSHAPPSGLMPSYHPDMPPSLSKSLKPTPAQLLAARDKEVPDLIQPDLHVLFCGINPGLYSAAVGHHFARPGNRFWPALHASGFTDRLLSPAQEQELLRSGLGITNIVRPDDCRSR